MSGSGVSWAICKSAPRFRQITMPAPRHSVFTGQMLFLTPCCFVWYWNAETCCVAGCVCGWPEHASSRAVRRPATNRAVAAVAWPLDLVRPQRHVGNAAGRRPTHCCHGPTWYVACSCRVIIISGDSGCGPWDLSLQESWYYLRDMSAMQLAVQLVAAMGPPGMWRSLLIAMSFRAE